MSLAALHAAQLKFRTVKFEPGPGPKGSKPKFAPPTQNPKGSKPEFAPPPAHSSDTSSGVGFGCVGASNPDWPRSHRGARRLRVHTPREVWTRGRPFPRIVDISPQAGHRFLKGSFKKAMAAASKAAKSSAASAAAPNLASELHWHVRLVRRAPALEHASGACRGGLAEARRVWFARFCSGAWVDGRVLHGRAHAPHCALCCWGGGASVGTCVWRMAR